MQLFVKVTPLRAGTSEASAEGELLRCPHDVEPATLLSFLTQLFGDVVDTAWTSTERHPRLACGWVFVGPGEHQRQEVVCVPLVATDDGSLRSMFELIADQRLEFDETARSGQLDDYTVITLPHRAYRPGPENDPGEATLSQESASGSPAGTGTSADPGGTGEMPPGRVVSTGGGHRHGAGRAATTEFPATWSDDEVLDRIISVARDPDLMPVWQPNQRWRVRGVRDGVEIFVIMGRDGAIATAWPLPGGRGVQQNPSWSMSPEEAQLARTMKVLPAVFLTGWTPRMSLPCSRWPRLASGLRKPTF
jgi:Bacterial EndoU nuclease